MRVCHPNERQEGNGGAERESSRPRVQQRIAQSCYDQCHGPTNFLLCSLNMIVSTKPLVATRKLKIDVPRLMTSKTWETLLPGTGPDAHPTRHGLY